MTLEETMITQELENTDLSKIAALQQKRTLAFINHFVITNVQFLNNFMKTCELKLMNFEQKLEKLNAAMVLLETRLSSIPEINTADAPDIIEKQKTEEITEVTPPDDKTKSSAPVEAAVETKPSYPEYDRFIKMVQVGVPVQAVKLKVSLEGLDPNILDEILGK